MEISALFCDRATARENGKLDIEGVFNELYAPGFPAKQDTMTFVGVVQWEHEDGGRHPFRVDLDHPDGHPIFTVDGHTDVESRPGSRAPAKTYLILPFEKVVFTSPGRYRVRAEIDGSTFDGPSLYLVESAGEEGA